MPLIAAHTIDVKEATAVIRNGLDACLTFEIDEHRQNHRQTNTLIYDFERAMQGPCLEMMLRGFLVDIRERDKTILAIKQDKTNIERIIRLIITAIQGSYNAKLPNSPKQLQQLFYDRMKLKPIERSANGETKRPMDRESLERLSTQDKYAAPIINFILLFRDLSKSLQVLETGIDQDWRWRCSYNIGGTSTGRWSSSKSPFGTGCVLPHVEALTLRGWKRIDKIIDGELIAQWDSRTEEIEWKPCEIFSQDFSGKMLRVSTEQLQQTLTPNHRIARYDNTLRHLYVNSAFEVSKMSSVGIPLAGKYNYGTLEIPRYASMLMADFSKEDTTWCASFKKERKINRFISLAAEFDLEYDEQPCKEGYRRFVIRNKEHICPKKWGPWILDLTLEAAEDLLEEARYWDATDRGSEFIFFTSDKDQAEWFATLAHLVNRSATIRLVQQNSGSTLMYWVNIKSRSHTTIQSKHWTEIPYEGKVYCPKVPSSYWLMREDGFISITGNSNFQNINEKLRRMFIPDRGFKLYGIDKAQSEARDVGWFCGTILGDWTYLDACESNDLHTYTTRLCYPDWDWTGDLKKDRILAERPFYRHFTYRDVSKRVGHASNYLGQPKEISKQTRLPISITKEFQERYFSIFPCIPRMHQWVAQKLQTERYLVNSFGRRRDFLDWADSSETLKSGVAYLFQSATGDCLNLGLWRLWKHMGNQIQILSQLHDAVYFQAQEPTSENAERKMLRAAVELIQIRQFDPWSGRSMTIPGEVVGGYNWAHRFRLREDGSRDDWNPRGLDKISI